MPTLSRIQRIALRRMSDENMGAVFIPGGPNNGWVFPVHIRESEEVAQSVVNKLGETTPPSRPEESYFRVDR